MPLASHTARQGPPVGVAAAIIARSAETGSGTASLQPRPPYRLAPTLPSSPQETSQRAPLRPTSLSQWVAWERSMRVVEPRSPFRAALPYALEPGRRILQPAPRNVHGSNDAQHRPPPTRPKTAWVDVTSAMRPVHPTAHPTAHCSSPPTSADAHPTPDESSHQSIPHRSHNPPTYPPRRQRGGFANSYAGDRYQNLHLLYSTGANSGGWAP